MLDNFDLPLHCRMIGGSCSFSILEAGTPRPLRPLGERYAAATSPATPTSSPNMSRMAAITTSPTVRFASAAGARMSTAPSVSACNVVRDLLLTAHRVDGDNATVDILQFRRLRKRYNLVELFCKDIDKRVPFFPITSWIGQNCEEVKERSFSLFDLRNV